MPFNYNIKYGNTEIFTSSAPLENIPIKYNDNTIATLSTESTIILSTKDKYAQGNI